MQEILQLDAIAQAEKIKNGQISPLELVNGSIAAIEKLNPTLNAVITPMFEQAREAVESVDMDAPFAGVPMVLKDGIATYQGIPQSQGSTLFRNNISAEDSELVKRYKQAGFVIVGKTNMPEFGLLPTTEPTAFGPTKNPWDISKTPGGSSGGTAAAVAARMVALGHGNDGGGSIRIPAACCGLFGLKPTRGRNPMGPMASLVSGLVEEHVLTRSVRDSAAVLDLTGQPDPLAFYHAPAQKGSYLEALDQPVRKLKIGYSVTQGSGKPVHEDCAKATVETIKLCEKLGHQVVKKPLEIPFTGKTLGEVFEILWAVGASSPMAFYEMVTKQSLPKNSVEPLSYELYQRSKKISGGAYELIRQRMHRIARCVVAFFQDIDLWISPVLGMPPVALGNFKQDERNPMNPMVMAAKFSPTTAIFNISGQPAASIPVCWNQEGLPIGVQVVGRFGDETTVFQLANQLEKEMSWEQRIPDLVNQVDRV